MSNISDISLFSDKAILATIGLFVQQTRIKQNLNQQELADKAAVSRSTVSLLERGENISLINLLKILRILDALYVLKAFEAREEISPFRLAKGEKKLRKRVMKKDTPQDDNLDLGW
ncbi:MAG TPA: helix-turn-helix domain-containing protein [Flavobacterium sp.]|nr:helix-turn-helix domain-containing protein [Flavobacterium sp.]